MMANGFQVDELAVDGLTDITLCITAMLGRSAWFEITPYPDDKWVIRVKRESGAKARLLQVLGKKRKVEPA